MGTRNTKQRAIRQEALREQLSKQKHLEHVVDLVKKIKDEDVREWNLLEGEDLHHL